MTVWSPQELAACKSIYSKTIIHFRLDTAKVLSFEGLFRHSIETASLCEAAAAVKGLFLSKFVSENIICGLSHLQIASG